MLWYNHTLMSGLTFTDRQRATIATAITIACTFAIAFAVLYLALLLIRFIDYFSGVFLPLAIAGILSLLLKPYFECLRPKVGSPVLALILVFASILVPIVLVFWFFGAMIADQIAGLIARIPEWIDQIRIFAQQRAPILLQLWRDHDVGQRLQSLMSEHGGLFADGLGLLGTGVVSVGQGVSRTVTALLSSVVMPVYLAFFLLAPPFNRTQVEALLPFLKPETRKDVIYLGSEFVQIILAFFRGQILVALMQGLLFSFGFTVLGIQYGLLLGLLLGFLNIIPYLGNLIGLAVILPLAFFQEGGGLILLLCAMGVFVVVQCIEGYVLTPRIMGKRTGLHPLAIMVAMFFWGTALGGIMGLVLAVPLTAFLVVFWRLLKAKYIKEIV